MTEEESRGRLVRHAQKVAQDRPHFDQVAFDQNCIWVEKEERKQRRAACKAGGMSKLRKTGPSGGE